MRKIEKIANVNNNAYNNSRTIKCLDIIIPVYKTENKIKFLLDSIYNQKMNVDFVVHICFTCSSQRDIDEIKNKYSNVDIIIEKKRSGKIGAINKLLLRCTSDIVILSSSDIVWNKNFLEKINLPFADDNVVVVASRPLSRYRVNFVGKLYSYYWDIHHQLSLISPKFGEAIAFRRLFKKIPSISNSDEEIIASLLSNKGMLVYAPLALVYNTPPLNIKQLFLQRLRYYTGHKALLKSSGYKSSALKFSIVLRASIRSVPFFILLCILMIELIVRMVYVVYPYDNLLWNK